MDVDCEVGPQATIQKPFISTSTSISSTSATQLDEPQPSTPFTPSYKKLVRQPRITEILHLMVNNFIISNKSYF